MSKTLSVAQGGSDSTGTGTSSNPYKTLAHAIEKQDSDGGRIFYSAGQYAAPSVTRAFTGWCEVISEGATEISGLLKFPGGAELVRFKGGSLRSEVKETEEIEAEAAEIHGANYGIDLVGMDISTGNFGKGNVGEGGAHGFALYLSFKSQWVRVRGCHIHDSWGGIGGGHIPANLDVNRSRYLAFTNCLIERCHGDLATSSSWDDVLFKSCVLRSGTFGNTTEEPHGDHFQFSGDEHRVTIDSCKIYQLYDPTNTEFVDGHPTQMVFLAGETGVCSEFTLINSEVWSQLEGQDPSDQIFTGGAKFTGNQPKLRVLYNTIWTPGYWRGLWLTATRGANADAVVVGNILGGEVAYKEEGGSSAEVRDYNLYMNAPSSKGAHDIVAADPKFVDAGSTTGYPNLELQSSSAAKEAGETTYAPKVDILGRPRGSKPSIGCYQ